MNEDTLNMQIRKFLKKVGITSQREIERGVHDALEMGRIKGDESLPTVMTLEVPSLGVKLEIEGEILLEKADAP
jgi:Family of unknown function (DUF6494)